MKGRIDIIAASAGSGKTTRLARELESAVVEQGIAPDRIVAMTFTRKAAAELVGRGRDALLRKGRADDAELFGAARIGTVNAVAGMLVSEFAFEAGVSPELIVLDEPRAADAFRRSLGEVVTSDDLDEWARLSGRCNDFPWLTIVRDIADAARTNHLAPGALEQACARSIRGFSELFDPATEDADTLDMRLELALDKAVVALRDLQSREVDTTKKSLEVLGLYERAQANLHAARSIPWSDWVELAQREAGKKSDAFCVEVRKAADVLLRHPGFWEDNALAIRMCFDLARRALEAYQRYKVARRAIDFIDQETIALSLLARPDVQELLAEEISLVLVDEFQDSSPLEMALFLALARIGPRSVWVGDQKQAIYGFRGADPALMEQVIAELLQGREPETLSVGRRSRAPLVHLTNALFVPPFRAAGLSPSRVTLEPATPEDATILGPCLERWRIAAQYQRDGALELAQLVRQLVDDSDVFVRGADGPRRVRPGDIAILCRRRETCLTVAGALGTVDVPVEMALGGLLATPEGRLTTAALRLWANPDDVLARAEIMQSMQPAMLTIDDLVDGANPTRWQDVQPITAILEAQQKSPHAGTLEAFDALAAALQLDDVVLQWGRGRRGIANLDALRAHAVNFVRLARHRGGAPSPAGFVAYLEALAEGTEDAQAAPVGADAVTMTTWHAAKGLEWPIVILYEIDGSFSSSVLGVHVEDDGARTQRLDEPLAGRTIRYWPATLQKNGSPLLERLSRHTIAASVRESNQREELRLLYVGFSRARDRLILAGKDDLAKGIAGLFAIGGGSVPDEPLAGGSPSLKSLSHVTWSGCHMPVVVRVAAPMHASAGPTRPMTTSIFERPVAQTYPQANVAAVMAEGQGRVTQLERLGRGQMIRGPVDPIRMGNAIHAFLAADKPTLDMDDRAEIASRLLVGWGVVEALRIDEMLRLATQFSSWIAAYRPAATMHHEWPVEHRLEQGTVLRGKIDVLVREGQSFVVVDHKIILANEADAIAQACGFYGQLAAYARALKAIEAGRTVETWVHLPLAGLIVRLEDSGQLDNSAR
ncbi:MAG TPA: UvrD-helicase domain-containing protein [Polyangium sp.]|nr:UvrD-helicase domain-containing protein [Polyangium sp.]